LTRADYESDDDMSVDSYPSDVDIDKHDRPAGLLERMDLQNTRWTRDLALQLLHHFDPTHDAPFWPDTHDFKTLEYAENQWAHLGGRPLWLANADIPGHRGLTGTSFLPTANGAYYQWPMIGCTILASPVLWDCLPEHIGVEIKPKRKSAKDYWTLSVMSEVKYLAHLHTLKFRSTSKNTIVAVRGVVIPTKKFHHLNCRLLYPGREKGIHPLSDYWTSAAAQKPRNFSYVAGTFICRVEVPRRFNYAVCDICRELFSSRQLLEWGTRPAETDKLYQAWLQKSAGPHL
jgi:hypothetical protein